MAVGLAVGLKVVGVVAIVVVCVIVTEVVCVVESQRRNWSGHTPSSSSVPVLNGVQMELAACLQGPAVATAQSWQSAKISGVRHRRCPTAHVWVLASANSKQVEMASMMQGPQLAAQLEQCSGVVVCDVVAGEVMVVVPLVVAVEVIVAASVGPEVGLVVGFSVVGFAVGLVVGLAVGLASGSPSDSLSALWDWR